MSFVLLSFSLSPLQSCGTLTVTLPVRTRQYQLLRTCFYTPRRKEDIQFTRKPILLFCPRRRDGRRGGGEEVASEKRNFMRFGKQGEVARKKEGEEEEEEEKEEALVPSQK